MSSPEVLNWPAHGEQIVALRKSIFLDELHYDPAFIQDESDEQSYHAGVFQDEELIAAGRIKFNSPLAFISHLCVKEEHRRKEIGFKLLFFLKKAAKEQDCFTIQLSANIDSMRFYEQAGFQAIDSAYQLHNQWHRQMKIKLKP